MQLPNDITANRHKNSPTSVAANETVSPTKARMRKQIYDWAQEFGNFTMRDVCKQFDKYPNEISGRLSEMKALRLIEETGEVIKRCAVLRVIPIGSQITLF